MEINFKNNINSSSNNNNNNNNNNNININNNNNNNNNNDTNNNDTEIGRNFINLELNEYLIDNNEKNVSSIIEYMDPWEYHVAAFILFLIGFFGFTLNIFVITFMCKHLKLWTPMNIILFNVICCDFMVSIFGNPVTLTAALSHKWIFGRFMCISYGFFMATLGMSSITSLTVLAYERYCIVQFPLSSRQFTKREAIISIIFIWIYALALTIPPLLGWGAYVNEAANISCSINWETRSSNAKSYIIYLFIFGLFVPVIVIMYSYINIIRLMKQSAERMGRENRGEKRITLMVAIMIFAFLFAWSPYAVFSLIMQFGPENIITPKMGVLPALLAKSSICYNPIIYAGCNTQFREIWKKRYYTGDSTVIDTTVHQISYSDTITTKCAPGKVALCSTSNLLYKKTRKLENNCNENVTIETDCTKLEMTKSNSTISTTSKIGPAANRKRFDNLSNENNKIIFDIFEEKLMSDELNKEKHVNELKIFNFRKTNSHIVINELIENSEINQTNVLENGKKAYLFRSNSL